MRIYTRLLLYVLTFLLFFTLFVSSIVVYILHTNVRTEALRLADSEVQKFALSTKLDLDRNAAIATSLATSALGYNKLHVHDRRMLQDLVIQQLLRADERIKSIVINWELSAIDSSYLSTSGRVLSGYFRAGGRLIYISKTMDLEGDDYGSIYYQIKNSRKPVFLPPYLKEYLPRYPKKDVVTMSFPILDKLKFLGTVELDLDLNHFDAIIRKIRPYAKSTAFIISPNGRIASHQTDSIVGKKLFDIFSQSALEPLGINEFSAAQAFSFFEYKNGVKYYASLSPIKIDGIQTQWMAGITAPLSVINDISRFRFWRIIVLVVFGFFVLCMLVWLTLRNITKPLRRIESVLVDINMGLLPNVRAVNAPKDEMDKITVLLVELVGYLKSKMDFAKEITLGNYNAELDVASEVDLLGHSLINLKENLRKASLEEAKRHEVDRKLNWASRGFNDYNTLVSQHQQNFDHFTKEIIVWLTKFTGMAIGGLYLVEESKQENSIRLYASHNYNKENKRRKKIQFGEGLVGRCVSENETIYQDNLPIDYIKISSGLGEETASYLLLVPLRLNQKAYGVIELASFIAIENYKIEFIEKVGENIAATVMNITATTQMTELLEQQKRQSNEIVKKELLTRDKIQDLLLNKEANIKQMDHVIAIKESYFKNMAGLELSLEGEVLKANDRFHLLLGFGDDELVGKNIATLYVPNQEFDLREFTDHLLKKRGLKRYIYLTSKGSKPKKLLSFWSLINDQNRLYIFVQLTDVSDFEAMLQAKEVVIQQLRRDKELLKPRLEPGENDLQSDELEA